ncbi:MAG: homocysteine S-methyltransferase family protein [Oscillibacter sp.]|nr:homocysteine S-methyltransferase family protein [Oscillibacter sp.]
MTILEVMQKQLVFLDGGMGTLLQEKGLPAGEYPERWNLTRPEVITEIHRAYFDAGSHVVNTNTFGASSLHFSGEELEQVVKSAIGNAKAARDASTAPQEKFIALDIGPTGRLLKPYGDFDFEEAVSVFAQTVRLGVKYGADLIMIETINDSYETKAALLAAKENSRLPVFVSNAYGQDGKLMTGASPAAMVSMLEGMGADVIGVNCSLGPRQLSAVVAEYLRYASVPVLLKPNAGLPKSENGKTFFDIVPAEFASQVAEEISVGVRVAGGCCGTTPLYIKEMVQVASHLTPRPVTPKNLTWVSSYTHAVFFEKGPILIGERINPTGKKRLKQALLDGDMDYVLGEGIRQQDKGVHVLDVNVGLPGIDETKTLKNVVCELQAIIDLPLQLDTVNTAAMELALRHYNGKAMINSVNGKEASMRAIFPLVKKYGGLVVALTLDENGIPSTAAGRLKIARNIEKTAAEYGIGKENLIFDTLAMTISADPKTAAVTLDSLARIRKEMGCHTSLGVSNVSFGLPVRDGVNSAFFALALGRGLSAAIMNPDSAEMMKTYYAYRALLGMDDNCADYIAFAAAHTAPAAAVSIAAEEQGSALQKAIVRGRKEQAGLATAALMETVPALDIVQNEIIPALDTVGKGYEEKTVYLPQLLMSAEAAKCAFEKIKADMTDRAGHAGSKCGVVIATVQGDIHDIGKNIVKLLLENYGFAVTDLGKDVPPEQIVEAVRKTHAPLVGLSALMTTTVPAMEETIRQLREAVPQCRVVVGGAVLNRDYAQRIGADRYAQNAMETVRYAEEIHASL